MAMVVTAWAFGQAFVAAVRVQPALANLSEFFLDPLSLVVDVGLGFALSVSRVHRLRSELAVRGGNAKVVVAGVMVQLGQATVTITLSFESEYFVGDVA